jgi:hypothetical protein
MPSHSDPFFNTLLRRAARFGVEFGQAFSLGFGDLQCDGHGGCSRLQVGRMLSFHWRRLPRPADRLLFARVVNTKSDSCQIDKLVFMHVSWPRAEN